MDLKEVVSALCCDRCGLEVDHLEPEFQEFTCIDKVGGYGSAFGDGNLVQIDLCQGCLHALLGEWIRVTPVPGGHDSIDDHL